MMKFKTIIEIQINLDSKLINGKEKNLNGIERKKILFILLKKLKIKSNKKYAHNLEYNKKIVIIAKISKLKN